MSETCNRCNGGFHRKIENSENLNENDISDRCICMYICVKNVPQKYLPWKLGSVL